MFTKCKWGRLQKRHTSNSWINKSTVQWGKWAINMGQKHERLSLVFVVFSSIKKCPISLLNEKIRTFPPKRDGNSFKFLTKIKKFHGITPLFCRAACCFLHCRRNQKVKPRSFGGSTSRPGLLTQVAMVAGWQKYFRADGVGYEFFVGVWRDHCGMSEKEGEFHSFKLFVWRKKKHHEMKGFSIPHSGHTVHWQKMKKRILFFSRTNLNIGTGGCCGRGGANQWKKSKKNSRLLLHSYLISYAHFQSKYIDLYIIYLNSVNFFKNG